MHIQKQAIELSTEELDLVAGGAIDFVDLLNKNGFGDEKLVIEQKGVANKNGSAGTNIFASESTNSFGLQHLMAGDIGKLF